MWTTGVQGFDTLPYKCRSTGNKVEDFPIPCLVTGGYMSARFWHAQEHNFLFDQAFDENVTGHLLGLGPKRLTAGEIGPKIFRGNVWAIFACWLVMLVKIFCLLFAAEILLYIAFFRIPPFLGGLRHVKPVEQPVVMQLQTLPTLDSHNLDQLDPNSIRLAISNIKSWKTMGHVWPPSLNFMAIWHMSEICFPIIFPSFTIVFPFFPIFFASFFMAPASSAAAWPLRWPTSRSTRVACSRWLMLPLGRNEQVVEVDDDTMIPWEIIQCEAPQL